MTGHRGWWRRALEPCSAALLTVVVTAATGSCSVGPSADGTAALAASAASADPGEDDTADAGGPIGVDGLGLAEVGWSVNEGLVSVLVRNDTGRVLRRAVVSAQALDADGVLLASSTTTGDQTACCTAVAVPPGATYGFYFAYDGAPDDVDDVAISFPDIAWSAQDAPRGPSVTGVPVELRTEPEGAVVVADLTTTGGDVDDVVVQATLVGPDGRLVSIVSGRWRCLSPGDPATAYVALSRDVPAGTTVQDVSAFALDAVTGSDADAGGDATIGPTPAC